MLKEAHFTPQRMLSMLGLKPDSLGAYALIPGPKERSEAILRVAGKSAKEFHFSRLRDVHGGARRQARHGRQWRPLRAGYGDHD